MRSGFFTRQFRDEERNEKTCAHNWRAAFLRLLIPFGLFVALFWSSFSSDASFAYRDVAYYYYPFFQQIQREWERGALPLWDPCANLGQPLLADPTASVFYPIKALFFLSSFGWLSYSTCFKLYLWLHVGLAFATSFVLARRLRVSRVGSLLSGLTYAFSGQVLFQYSNVVYLVGSAWAPAFFIFLVDYLRATNFRLKFRTVLKSSVVYALSVLGGEPQIVYICLASSAVILLLAPKRSQNESASLENKRARFADTALYCGTTALLTFLLAAIQILPSAELVGRSERSQDKLIRSVWDLPKAALKAREKDADSDLSVEESFRQGSLCLDFSEAGRSCSIYRFSVGAWRWSEFLFPNVGGRQFPQSARWFEATPEELAVWTPTLYCGVLPVLLAFGAARFRRRKNATGTSDVEQNYARVVATWGVILGALAALGGFGVVWHIRASRALLGGDSVSSVFCNGDPVGGLYWLLNLLAPKFVEFRYPAKMLTTSVLGVAILAGVGWDRERNSRRFQGVALALLTCAVVLFGTTIFYGASFFRSFSTCNPLYGPFQPQLAEGIVRRSFLQTSLVVACSFVLLYFARRLRNLRVKNALLFATLATTALDIYVANAWIIDVAPTKLFERPSEIARQIEDDRAAITSDCAPPTRVYRYPVWFPPVFQEESSPKRTAERVLWDAATLYPKYPFRRGIAVIDARGATMESAYCAYVDQLIARTNVDEELAFLGVEGVVGPRCWVERILPSPEDESDAGYDQSVAVRKVRAKPTRAALFRDGKRVESNAQNCVETLEYIPNRIVYFVSADEQSEVVFAEQYWNDWRAKFYELTPEEADVLRAARGNKEETEAFLTRRARDATRVPNVAPVEKAFDFLRKVETSKGAYCVVVEYRPRAFFWGAATSIFAWGVLIIIGLAFLFVEAGRFRILPGRKATFRPD